MPFIVLLIYPPFMEELPPQLFRSTLDAGKDGREESRKREKRRRSGRRKQRKNAQKEHQMADQQEKNDSEDDNQIAIDQLDLMQKMIPEDTPSLPSAEEEEEEEKKNEKQLQIEEPREVQRQEASRARKVGERKWGNPKETKPSTQRK